MRIHVFTSDVRLPRPREEVFAFFSDARNLEQITPPWMKFEIVGSEEVVIQKGTLIDYKLRIHGLPLRWRSEITVWEPPALFADRQLRGPYRLWIHEHRFTEENGGTRAYDQVRYAVPGGRIVNALFVARDIREIFEFRSRKLQEIFPAP